MKPTREQFVKQYVRDFMGGWNNEMQQRIPLWAPLGEDSNVALMARVHANTLWYLLYEDAGLPSSRHRRTGDGRLQTQTEENPMSKHPHHHDNKPAPDDPSKAGADTTPGTMNPVEPTQAELDADRAANPDTSAEQSKDGSGG